MFGKFLDIASRVKEICRRYGVPIIINDRIDIALAMEADGVHVGQTDMPIAVARKLLPANALIGVSCNSVKEAEKAIQDGADYIGIGAVWSTQTKQLTSPIVGVRGVGEILDKLNGTSIKAVAIGIASRVFNNWKNNLTFWNRRNQLKEYPSHITWICVSLRKTTGWCCSGQ